MVLLPQSVHLIVILLPCSECIVIWRIITIYKVYIYCWYYSQMSVFVFLVLQYTEYTFMSGIVTVYDYNQVHSVILFQVLLHCVVYL